MRYVTIFALLLALAGCGSTPEEPVDLGRGVGPGMCSTMFEHASVLTDQAAREDEIEEAAKFCGADQWMAEATRFPGALAGADPAAYLRGFCTQPNSETTLLCSSAAERGLVSPGVSD
jgi:hypothetical protein